MIEIRALLQYIFLLISSFISPLNGLMAQSGTGLPDSSRVWVFILAGQSNMAGRGLVESVDTVTHPRIFALQKDETVKPAREPLHFYEPRAAGLDCGMSFARALLQKIPDSISLLLIPAAVGGSSISQWLGDSVHRSVQLFSNFSQKLAIGQKKGTVKAILWHQGENDALSDTAIALYPKRLAMLMAFFRSAAGNQKLPVLLGELGSFSDKEVQWQSINQAIHTCAETDAHCAVITTADLEHKGDKIHFNAEGQRTMGRRFAAAYFSISP